MSAHEHERPRAYPTVLDMVHQALAKVDRLKQENAEMKKRLDLVESILRGDGK